MAQHTCTVNPPDRTETNQSPAPATRPSCTIYLPPISFLALSPHTKTPHDSNLFKTKSNFFQAFMFWHKVRRQHTNMLIRHFICKFAVRIEEWQWVYVVKLILKLKSHPMCRLGEGNKSFLKSAVAILRDIIILRCEKKQGTHFKVKSTLKITQHFSKSVLCKENVFPWEATPLFV